MNIPKVEVRVAQIDKIFFLIHEFLNPAKNQWDWSNSIYRNYPELKSKLQNFKDKKKRKEIEYFFFTEVFKKERIKLEKRAKIFQREWNKINDNIMLVLSKVVEQEWSDKDKKIFARISLNPICPRYIKQKTFDLFYKQKSKYMKSVAIHEILHFIYFEKWKKVFPKTQEKEFNAPNLVWHLSEMVPEIILNDKRVQNVFKYKFDSYKEYENFKLNGKPLLSYLQDFYDNRKNFADFLKNSWKFVKKYEKEINSI
jgi:hypothetical protein